MKKILFLTIAPVLIMGISITSVSAQSQYEIPSWVKGIAGFWAEGNISDSEFGEGLVFLIDNGIINVPVIQELESNVKQLQSENNRLKDQVSSLQRQNTDLQNKLNQQSTSTTSQSTSTTTTKSSSDLNYPKIPKRINGENAIETLRELGSFHSSLTASEKNQLVNRAVTQSQFTIVIVYPGNWNLTTIVGNFDFIQYEGSGISVIPFDCSTNMDYIYSIVGVKEDETEKISIWLFKNGVLIDYDEAEKPYGTTTMGGLCDEPSVLNSIR